MPTTPAIYPPLLKTTPSSVKKSTVFAPKSLRLLPNKKTSVYKMNWHISAVPSSKPSLLHNNNNNNQPPTIAHCYSLSLSVFSSVRTKFLPPRCLPGMEKMSLKLISWSRLPPSRITSISQPSLIGLMQTISTKITLNTFAKNFYAQFLPHSSLSSTANRHLRMGSISSPHLPTPSSPQVCHHRLWLQVRP